MSRSRHVRVPARPRDAPGRIWSWKRAPRTRRSGTSPRHGQERQIGANRERTEGVLSRRAASGLDAVHSAPFALRAGGRHGMRGSIERGRCRSLVGFDYREMPEVAGIAVRVAAVRHIGVVPVEEDARRPQGRHHEERCRDRGGPLQRRHDSTRPNGRPDVKAAPARRSRPETDARESRAGETPDVPSNASPPFVACGSARRPTQSFRSPRRSTAQTPSSLPASRA